MQNKTHPLPRPRGRRSSSGLIAALLIAAAALLLSACGSSSSSAAGTSSAKTTPAVGSPAGRFASLRECLKKQGIDLPVPSGKPGGGGPPSGGGGFRPPSGSYGAKFREAIKKCGGGGFPARGRGNLNSANAKAALTKFASCMRENSIDLPAPDTSGKGPVFNTKGLNSTSQAFKRAQKTCQSDLKGAFRAGAPPSGG